METNKLLTDQRQIAGYLRDALFHCSAFVIHIGDRTYGATLVNITEQSARDKTCERSLLFDLAPGNTFLADCSLSREHAEFSVALDRLLLSFKATIIDSTSGTLTVSLPVEAKTVTSRKTHRFKSENLSPRICNIAVAAEDGQRLFGTFEILDVSSDGLGGVLTVSRATIPTGKLRISGKLLQENGAISIDGVISRSSPLSSTSKGSRYKIGIKNSATTDDAPEHPAQEKERRTRTRQRADFPIEVISPLFPKNSAVLQLEDISLAGLRARFLNLADSSLFRPGLEVTLVSPRLRLLVKTVTSKHATFEVLRSALDEHIKLFNQQSFLSHRDLASGTNISSDVAQVYTTSGSFSTSLARSLSANRDYIFQSVPHQSFQVQWFLRWLQQAQDGRIRAAFLSAPYSDHVWYVGGLAGHIDSELKMSADFVPRFFRGLDTFFESLGTQEYFFINWFKTNSWWSGWETWLATQSESIDSFRFSGDIAYLQNLSNITCEESTSPRIKTLRQNDVAGIEEALASIASPSIRRLFGALGLGAFGSRFAATSELLERAGHHFSRSFHSMSLKNCSILIMLSTFPSNVFPNGILNYPFVYASRQLTEKELELLIYRLCDLSVQTGLECPAFFLTVDGAASALRDTPSLSLKEVVWTFGSSRMLSYWKDK